MDELALKLPSGRGVRVRRVGDGAPVDDDRVDGKRTFSGRLLNALDRGRLVVEDRDDAGRALSRDALLALDLPDYHAVRDAAWRVGATALEPTELVCRNCDAPLSPRPEDAPIEDIEDWYLDGLAPDDELRGPFALEAAVALGAGRRASTVDAHPVTAATALPLFVAVEKRGGVRVSPAIVRALGIVALGDERDVATIARALDRASDEAWRAVETLYVLLAYSPRATFPKICASCGALHDIPAPPSRELDLDPHAADVLLGERAPATDAAAASELGPFPDEDAFAARALDIGRAVYREMGVQNIELEVVFDTPPVDDAGEPLLGSYQPLVDTDVAGYTDVGFLIQVYYRTFARMYEDEPYDVDDELRETIAHEVEHHLHHLSGRDPMDEAERAEAAREIARTFGERAVRRAEVRAVAAEARRLVGFALAAVVVVAAIAGLLWAIGRL